MNLPIRISCLLIFFTAFYSCKKDAVVTDTVAAKKIAEHAVLKPKISSISPSQGMVFGAVRITGTNFSPVVEGNVVRFNGFPAIVNSASKTELIVTVPENTTTGTVSVLSNDFVDTFATPFKVLKFTPEGEMNINLNGVTETAITKTGIVYSIRKNAQKLTAIIKSVNGTSTIVFNDAPEFEDQLNYFDHDYKGLLTDNAGNVYFASNYIRHRSVSGVATHTVLRSQIIKISPADNATLIAGGEAGAVDGNGSNALFNNIEAMVRDAAGNLYVSDLGNSRLRKVTPAGDVTTLSTSAKIKNMAISSSGDLYFHNNLTIYKASAATGKVSFIAGPYANGLQAMLFDAAGNLLVCNYTGILVINRANYLSRFVPPTAINTITMDPTGKLYTFSATKAVRYAFK
ncbi:MAG: hypothetical protein EOP51_21250 [Sphingobacteriales bacterium]|nr:MAG: hypothetical protein EOP51_21250 [Sphingobacteriales bacterium]